MRRELDRRQSPRIKDLQMYYTDNLQERTEVLTYTNRIILNRRRSIIHVMTINLIKHIVIVYLIFRGSVFCRWVQVDVRLEEIYYHKYTSDNV